MVRCHAENVIDCARYSTYAYRPLKLQLSSVPVHGLNFLSGLHDVLDGIASSKDGHHGCSLTAVFRSKGSH